MTTRWLVARLGVPILCFHTGAVVLALASGARAGSDEDGIVAAVLGAHRVADEQLPRGRGRARVRTEYVGRLPDGSTRRDAEDYVCVFAFDGPRFRAETYARAEASDTGVEGRLVRVDVDDGENSFGRIVGANAFIAATNQSGSGIESHVFGRDFRPRSFRVLSLSYMDYELPLFMRGLTRFTSEREEPDGLLAVELNAEFDDKDKGGSSWAKQAAKVLFDPRAHYAPVRVDYACTMGPPERSIKVSNSATYGQWKDVCYPSSFRLSCDKTEKRDGELVTVSSRRVTVDVAEFVPNADIDGICFTFAGLGVEPGTEVIDFVLDTQYKYMSEVSDEMVLEHLLASSPTLGVAAGVDATATSFADGQNRPPPPPNTERSRVTVPPKPAVVPVASASPPLYRRLHFWGLVAAPVCVVFAGCLALRAYRRKGCSAGRRSPEGGSGPA